MLVAIHDHLSPFTASLKDSRTGSLVDGGVDRADLVGGMTAHVETSMSLVLRGHS
jgi:hypothetical protein